MPVFKQLLDVMGFVDVETKEDQEISKPYLILLTDAGCYDDTELEDSFREFQALAMRGRKAVFDYFCDLLGSYDLIHSYVMSGKIPLGKEVTLYSFLRLCVERYFAQSSAISIDELDTMAYQTSNVNPEKFDLNILYQRETGRHS